MASLKLLRWLFGGLLAVFHLSGVASELVADPTWQTGKLANGFSWQILATPQRSADNVEIRLVIRSGSLNESSSQSGYNHLLTKIALNASATENAAAVPALWQSDQENPSKVPPAICSYEFTQFNFSLPVNKPILLKDALRWLSITTGDLPINADIIQSALVAPDRTVSFPADAQDPVWQFRIKDSGLMNHYPLALPNTPIDRDKLLAFYQQWFTPDAMTLYVVGNVESRSVIEAINKNFSKLTSKREKPAQMAILAPLAHKTAYLTNQAYTTPRLGLFWDMPWAPIQDTESLYHYWLRELVREAVLLRVNGNLDGSEFDKNMVCHMFYQREYCELTLPVDTKLSDEGQNSMLDAISLLITKGLTEAEFQQLMNVQSERLAAIYLTYAHLSTRNLIERRLIFSRNNVADIAPEQFQTLRKTFLNSLNLSAVNQAIFQQLSQPASFLLLQHDEHPTLNLDKLQANFEKKITDHLASLNQEQKHSNTQE